MISGVTIHVVICPESFLLTRQLHDQTTKVRKYHFFRSHFLFHFFFIKISEISHHSPIGTRWFQPPNRWPMTNFSARNERTMAVATLNSKPWSCISVFPWGWRVATLVGFRNMEIWHPLFEGFPIVRHGNTLECNTFFYLFMFFWRFDDSSIVSFTCSWKHFCWNSSAEGWNETSRCCTWRDELNVANGSLSPLMKLRPSRADSAKSDPLKILVEFQIGLYSKRYDSSENPLGLKSNSLNIISLRFFGNSLAHQLPFETFPREKLRPWGGEG